MKTRIKLIFVHDTYVWKISITYQYMNIIINDEQISTITIHRANKDIKLRNGEIIKVDN